MAEHIINHPDPQTADIVLLAAPYDGTSSFIKGADQGPKALQYCFDTQMEIYEHITGTLPAEQYKIAYDDSLALDGLAPEAMVDKVYRKYTEYYSQGKFIILVGGEHSVSLGAFKCLAGAPEEITVIQIDAHADLRNDDSDYVDDSPSPFAHSCVMRRVIEDFKLKTVQIGTRIFSREEHEYIRSRNLTVFPWGSSIPAVETIIKSIDTEKIYISLDIDGVDPAHLPATGTPVPGGLEWYYAINLLQELFKNKTVVSTDLVELAPQPHDHRTEFGAAQLCYLMLGCRLKYKSK